MHFRLPLLFIVAQILPSTIAIIAPAGCRKLPTDSDWPSPETWKKAIPGVIAGNDSDASGPLPNYRLQATDAAQVQAAIRFVKHHNIRVQVITTGHDQLGRSDAGSGLLIDLSKLKGVRVMESYTPTRRGVEDLAFDTAVNTIKAKPGVQAAVTFGPGVAGFPLNAALANSSLFTTSGAAATVALAGGWGHNGGYGPMTAQYGLGVDQWLEAKIIAPDGSIKVLNEVSNPDLFWAIRGGGGGTFGVLIQATWKAHPTVPMIGFNWYLNSTATNQTADPETGVTPISSTMTYLFSQLPHLQGNNISAYFYVAPFSLRVYSIHPADQANSALVQRIWEPILDKAQSFPGMSRYQTTPPFHFGNYTDFFRTTYGPMPDPSLVGSLPRNRGIVPFESRLLNASHVTDPSIAYYMRETRGNYGLLLCAPGRRVGDGSNTAANPGWRDAVVLVVGQKTPTTSLNGLRKLAPDMGSYINEASTTESNWTASFWGTNYPRLSQLKSRYDPDMLFWVSPGINADRMEVRDGRVCRVRNYSGVPSLIPPAMERNVTADMQKDGAFLFGEQEIIGNRYPAKGEKEGFWWA
ncbi:FAD-binding domain-containing protein 44 [Elsinoe fawcettii]|nr:FAD-binding domain-containing protein 44 [Elsinoe fawcettii]